MLLRELGLLCRQQGDRLHHLHLLAPNLLYRPLGPGDQDRPGPLYRLLIPKGLGRPSLLYHLLVLAAQFLL